MAYASLELGEKSLNYILAKSFIYKAISITLLLWKPLNNTITHHQNQLISQLVERSPPVHSLGVLVLGLGDIT